MRDEIAWVEHRLAMRRFTGQQVKFPDRYGPDASWSLNMDRRIQHCQCYAHVRRVRRDAMLARAENGERPVAAGDRRAPGPRLAFVAGHGGIAEIGAACPLQQVSRGRGHIAELRRSTREEGLRQGGVISLHGGMMGKIGVADSRSNLQPAVRRGFDPVEGQTVDINDLRRCFDVQFHQINQCRATGKKANLSSLLRGLRLRRKGNRLCGIFWSNEFKYVHCWCCLLSLTNLLDRSDDVGISSASADVAAH